MKNLFKYSIGVLFAGLTMTACSPDSFDGADINGIPSVSGVDFTMTVDQETNQMIANYTPAAGIYPIWILNGTSYSTLSEVGYQNPEAGTYSVELKLGNRNGFSQGTVSKTFTFNETKVDYSADFRRITGKEWRFANKEQGHLGCGPAGTAGTEWWSCGPDGKADTGMYDDRITFTADTRKGGTFNYSAGADGLTYVNTGTTIWGSEAADWDATIGDQSAAWSFEVYDWTDAEGNVSKQTYIQLAPNTAFPYISSDAQYQDPKFRIESLTASKMVLVYDAPDGGIAWRFIFTSAADERLVEEQGFDANNDFNMWKGITPTTTFYYNPGWATEQTPVLEAGFTGGNNDYSITVPDACNDRWQAQMHLHTDLSISAANHYDFSCIFVADKDIDGITVKLTNETDADAIIDVDNISLKAGKEYVFWQSDLEGKDLSSVKLVFDFGRAAEPTTINISSIVLKDHANDDGTKVPSIEPGGDTPTVVMDWDVAAGSNLWSAVESGDAFIQHTTWFADGGWQTLPTQPEIKHANGAWEFAIPDGIGGDQWQGQFAIETTLTAVQAKKYNVYLTIDADQDCNGVTIKFTETNGPDTDENGELVKHDGNFFFADRHNLKADVQYVFKAENVTLPLNDAHAMSFVFDFGGSPAGTNVKISNIYFEEAVSYDYNDATNLWKAVDEGSALIQNTTWFANDGWGTLDNQPKINHEGSVWSFDIPDGIGTQQWQGQFALESSIACAQNDPYYFQITLLADQDCNGVTIKFTETNGPDTDENGELVKHDTNFYFDGRHNLKADEPYTYKVSGCTLPKNDGHAMSLVLDFGGSPAGTHVEVKDIILVKQ